MVSQGKTKDGHKLILVKHSLPKMVPTQPANCWHLSPEGRDRCQLLAERLAIFDPVTIFSSSEPKALETAEIVSKHLEKRLEVWNSLREHERSNVPLLPKDEFQSAVRGSFERPKELVFGSETAQ